MLVEDTDTRATRRNVTKARILRAAWRLARRDGLAAISLREVAARVGMRAPSLYNHFPSKNAIYDAMYAESVRGMAEVLNQRQATVDPRETLRNRVRLFIEFCTADPLRYQLIFERPIPGFEPTPESFAISVSALAGTRTDLEAAGVHGERALDMLRALITGLVSLQVANDEGGDRWTRLQDDALNMVLDYYTDGRRPAPPAGRRRGRG
jgi:AcrR family transcriptional regulator